MPPSLGFSLDTGSNEITAVKPGGIAERAGLRAGDILIELDGLAPVAFLASTWWPRDDGKPVLAKIERDGAKLWRVLIDADEAEHVAAPPAAPLSADPFKGMLERPPDRAGDEQDKLAKLRRDVAALEARVLPKPLLQASRETEPAEAYPRHLYAPPTPLTAREQAWLRQRGTTGREATPPPMTGMPAGWRWSEPQN